MKVSAKPTSSPGRTESFPPPLMRFLRSKSSRGSRSRASTMFVREINAVQEPSSPKVTCIGQVRVRSSNNTRTTPRTATIRRCRWLRRFKPRSIRRGWRRWAWYFRCGYCKNPEKLRDSKQVEAEQINDYPKREVIGAGDEVLISESPPRDAFLLTRCRSAPYRSSSLASKIWESTMEETGEVRDEDETGKKAAGKMGSKEEGGGNDGTECSINGVEELKARPLSLSRSKSEPARTGDKLFMSFGS